MAHHEEFALAGDINGNRKTRNDGTNSDVYTYDDGDKLLNVKRNLNNWREYVYDGAGNTTARKKWSGSAWQTETLTYDWQDRMVTQAIAGGADAEHVYNGVNTRVATGELGKAPNNVFARDGVGVTAPVMRDSNAAYTPGTSERRSGVSTFSHSGIKNANVQTSSTGAIAATRTYDAFGNTVASTGTWKGPFGYAGQFGYQEDASGLKLLGNRYYDAEIGRFITKDPIKDGRNWYAYCDNNPVRRRDANGLDWVDDANDFSGGMADVITSGSTLALLGGYGSTTEWYRGTFGLYLDPSSPFYRGGTWAGYAWSIGLTPGGLARLTGFSRVKDFSRVGKLSEKGGYVMGRTMDDCAIYAEQNGLQTITDWLNGRPWTLELNLKWMLEMIRRGETLYDIGRGPGRPWGNWSRGFPPYLLERIIVFVAG